ncbi:MAG: hypothetical protein AB9873_09905 [Syntrophobacteraceae bacterium]
MGFFAEFEDEVVMERYRHIRRVSFELNETLVRRIPKQALRDCAKQLGMLSGKTLVFQNPNEAALLFDYCLYSYRPGGKSIMELHLTQSRPEPESDEMALLRSMMMSRFSLFSIEEVFKGIGVVLVDRLRQEKLFLLDVGMGNSGVRDLPLAGRIIPIGDLYMSTGVLLPILGKLLDAMDPILERLEQSNPHGGTLLSTPGKEAAFAAQVIRAAVRTGALNNVASHEM